MKCARPDESKAGAAVQGAAIVPGILPTRKDTVTAEVLSRLLAGKNSTALDAVSDASTTRLAAVVHRLRNAYGWRIDKTDKAAGCRDGRVAWVAEYAMPAELLRAVETPSVAIWCQQVSAARAARRQQAPQARKLAARFNDASRCAAPAATIALKQRGLFEGGML